MVYGHWLFRLPGFRQYEAMCLGRTILFRALEPDVSPQVVAHELVHQKQMDRHGIPGFYARYLWEYAKGLLHYRNHDQAYRNNPFEAEAYASTGPEAGGAQTSLNQRGKT